MDAAKGATGHGWPFAPGLWSNDGVREPAAGGPDAWGKTFWLLLGRLPKVTRRKGESKTQRRHRCDVQTQHAPAKDGGKCFAVSHPTNCINPTICGAVPIKALSCAQKKTARRRFSLKR